MNNINRSSNELESLLKRAAMGATLDVGSASLFASAVLWALQRKVANLADFQTVLANGHFAEATLDMQENRLILGGSVLRTVPAALELLLAARTAVDADYESAWVMNVDNSLMCHALAGLFSEQHQVRVAMATGHGATLSQPVYLDHGIRGRLPVEFAPEIVEFRLSDSDVPAGAAHQEPLCTRFGVDDDVWAWYQQWANRLLVPESEHSRLHGAGAGLVDND